MISLTHWKKTDGYVDLCCPTFSQFHNILRAAFVVAAEEKNCFRVGPSISFKVTIIKYLLFLAYIFLKYLLIITKSSKVIGARVLNHF